MIRSLNPLSIYVAREGDNLYYSIECMNKHNNEFLLDPSLQTLTAVKERKLYYPREGYIYNVSQDIVFGVQELAYAAYGESFIQPADCHLSVVEE